MEEEDVQEQTREDVAVENNDGKKMLEEKEVEEGYQLHMGFRWKEIRCEGELKVNVSSSQL